MAAPGGIHSFGTLPGGEPVQRVVIGDGTLKVSVIGYGAALQSVHLAGVPHSLCLGYGALDDYRTRGGMAGAIVGRVANRIGGGTARIDGRICHFDRNENGRHTLHGGANGLGSRNWRLSHADATCAEFSVSEADGANGFPGTLQATARYEVMPGGVLRLSLEAMSDAPTLCNLAPHPYFNLDGGGDARRQALWVDADSVLAVDGDKVPTGALEPVAGTDRDHRQARPMTGGTACDNNFCLSRERTALRPVAHLTAAKDGVSMAVRTTEPGLQVYDGAGLDKAYAGIAIEPQGWPDAPNHPDFPSIALAPGMVSRQVTEFVFGLA